MGVKTANLGPTAGSAVMHGSEATLHTLHWSSSTKSGGQIQLHNATSTAGTVLLIVDTPDGAKAGSAGDFPLGSDGLKFTNAIYAKKTNTGGLTISFATSV